MTVRRFPIASRIWLLALALTLAATVGRHLRHNRDSVRPVILGWDNGHYFAWARSVAVDGDADFDNDFRFLAAMPGGGENAQAFAQIFARGDRTPAGRPPNKYGIGLGLLAMPLVFVARGAVAAYEGVSGVEVSRFAAIYNVAFIAASVMLAYAGLAVAFRVLALRFGRRPAGMAVAAVALGTPLGHYIWFAPTMAHAAAFACTTAAVAVALWWREALDRGAAPGLVAWRAALAGAACGFAATVRYPCMVIALVPAAFGLSHLLAGLCPAGRRVAAVGVSLAAGLAGAALGFLPQLIAWKCVYGSWVVYSYAGVSLSPWPVHGLKVLFSPRVGLFYWTPLALLAVGGLVWAVVAARERLLAAAMLLVLGATLWVYGGWEDWGLGSTFGMRGFVDVSLCFMVGVAFLGSRAAHAPVRARVLTGLLAVLAVGNIWLMLAYKAGVIPAAGPLDVRQVLSQPGKILRKARGELRFERHLFGRKFPLFTPADTLPGDDPELAVRRPSAP
ncbi:MAG: hypothetical protein N2111_13950 [Candidatus Sumerlaeaceae bacterium]|nr:hypothetical protein [Candidatus Sumerlaeaceae bacterium]